MVCVVVQIARLSDHHSRHLINHKLLSAIKSSQCRICGQPLPLDELDQVHFFVEARICLLKHLHVAHVFVEAEVGRDAVLPWDTLGMLKVPRHIVSQSVAVADFAPGQLPKLVDLSLTFFLNTTF